MDVLLQGIILRRLHRRRRRVKKRRNLFWIHPIHTRRPVFGSFNHLFPDLLNDPKKFYNYFRMSPDLFFQLRNLIAERIRKENTNYRAAISPEERLAVFLRYLATGESFTSLSYTFRMGISTIHYVVKELNEVVWTILQPLYMPVPTAEKWRDVAQSFYTICQMPNCVGSIDGKHCRIKCPPNAGSQFYNYKHFHSVVLMAVADAKSNFILIDVGAYGRDNDSTVFSESTMGRAFKANALNIPGSQEIINTDINMPFYLVGDEAFPLSENLMRPYARRQLNFANRIFNYRLSRARRTVECAFGILTKKFGIFQKAIETDIQLTEGSIKSACVIHNFVRQTQNESDKSLETEFLEQNSNNLQLQSLRPTSTHRANTKALQVREKLTEYFMSPGGSVPWQNEKCRDVI
ncbi:uncharacterized protein LOC116170224 [Photinus pyralis]|uniref:uncharacterized protein LOC116170224 n=1 Tax=Photinus pyralis TaxID=7054 RepID=UPI0012677B01|nr:uncharacterized protein LOC116170224 [Photinus pyralis]